MNFVKMAIEKIKPKNIPNNEQKIAFPAFGYLYEKSFKFSLVFD